MRLSAAALLIGASLKDASAFPLSRPSFAGAKRTQGSHVILRMSEGTEAKKTKPASPADLLARARTNAGLPEDDDPPKLFDDDILDDMRQCLLKLEKRVKEGPGSLTSKESGDFEAATQRILDDMNDKLAGAATSAMPQGASSSSSSSSSAASPAAVQPPSSPPPSTAGAEIAKEGPSVLQPTGEVAQDTSNDEGPAYTGKGGLGLAQGTRNTYVIPGMDEMSPEEYRTALQKSVIDRQEDRRRRSRGVVGNRAAHSYLDTLGWGGATSSLAAEDPDQKGQSYAPQPELFDTGAEPAPAPPPAPGTPVATSPPPPVQQHDPVIDYGGQSVPSVHERPSAAETDKVIDTSNDEGPAYTGEGGLGLAEGTRNTYVIPGMDEMSPEEYRAALQKSVTDTQEKRRQAKQGVVGNRAAHSYLDQLGWGGASSGLASEQSDSE